MFTGKGDKLPVIVTNIDKLRVKRMGNLSRNFSRKEFACKCGCGFSTVDYELLNVLELVRNHFNSSVTINSASRCSEHNEDIGGSYGSKHKKGIAADIVVKDVDPGKVYRFLDGYAPNKYGIGKYKTFTHIDVRPNKARWAG